MHMFLNFLSWFNLPSLSDTYTSPGVGTTTGVLNLATEYSSEFFTSLTIIIGVAVGIPIAIFALKWLFSLLKKNTKKPFVVNYDPQGKKFAAWQKRTPRTWYSAGRRY